MTSFQKDRIKTSDRVLTSSKLNLMQNPMTLLAIERVRAGVKVEVEVEVTAEVKVDLEAGNKRCCFLK